MTDQNHTGGAVAEEVPTHLLGTVHTQGDQTSTDAAAADGEAQSAVAGETTLADDQTVTEAETVTETEASAETVTAEEPGGAEQTETAEMNAAPAPEEPVATASASSTEAEEDASEEAPDEVAGLAEVPPNGVAHAEITTADTEAPTTVEAAEAPVAMEVEAEAPTTADAEAPTTVGVEAPATVAEAEASVAVEVEAEAPAVEAEASVAVEVEAEAPAVEAEAPTTVGVEAPATVAEAEASVAVEVEAEAPAAVEAEAEAPATVAEAEAPVMEAEAEAPAAVEAEAEAPATVAEAEAPVEEVAAPSGASFTPVAEEETEKRPRRLKDLEVGMQLSGRVTSIALYGVFVDVGVGRDGLVHISEMSNSRIDSPSDLVQIGDTVDIWVKGVDLDSRRISLSMRAPTEERRSRRRNEVDRERLSEMSVGDVVDGTVTGLSSFGAFVDIGVGKDGLVHISELAEGRIEKPGDAVKVGEIYTFKLLEVDPDGNRISLSLRRAQRAQRLRELEPNQMLEGTVSGLAAFGAFVDIGVGRDGLVHISQLSEERVGKVEDVVQIGQKVTVRVLEVDSDSKRISLTMRPEREPEPEESAEDTQDERTAPSSHVVDPTSPEKLAAFEAVVRRERDDNTGGSGGGRRDRRDRRDRRPNKPQQAQSATTELYSTDDGEEEFTGNATLEDLVNKFGGSARKDRRRRDDDDDDDQDSQDVISRTLQGNQDN